MNRPDPPFFRELEELKARADRLAREKANFGLLTDLMRKLSTASGLDNVAENILHTLMGTIGGTNLTLYYRADGEFNIRDIYGRKERLPGIDEAAVREAFETRSFVEDVERTGQEAHAAGNIKGRTWIFPMHVGSNCIGALKMEGVLVLGAEMQPQIASFLKYAGLVLNNEIHNYSKLQAALEETEEANRKLLAEIEERKRAEEALRKSEERTRTILQTAMDGIWLTDTQGRLVEVNETYCRMSGYGAQELLTMRIPDLEAMESADETTARMQKLIAKGEDRFESRHRRKDGKIFDVEISIQYRPAEGGRCVVFLRDITGRKRAEEERERLQDQLHQAMKMEAVGRLAGGVAHDFNNLLTVISGYSELLLRKVGKESPMHGELEEIRRAGSRAASLTQQLLAFSRKQVIEPKVIHLDHLVAEMHKMLTRLIGEDISIQVTTGKSTGSVKIDPGQFQQILMNLAVNARDAMQGGGKIVIETANVDLDAGYCASHPYVTPGRYVMLSVSDTGKGMSEEVKAHIFEPFFTTKAKGSGTGLGLAMTYGAVRQAGGSIEVCSEVGIGTTFKIFIPRIEEEAKPVKAVRPQGLPGGAETVLLVEDEETVRTLCAQILGAFGYKVLKAGNGAEAVALVQGYGARIDLLLTDVVMPGMNGSELARRLVIRHPEMRILFTSGYTDDAIGRHGVLQEGVSFIGKPYSPEGLARKVREVLDRA